MASSNIRSIPGKAIEHDGMWVRNGESPSLNAALAWAEGAMVAAVGVAWEEGWGVGRAEGCSTGPDSDHQQRHGEQHVCLGRHILHIHNPAHISYFTPTGLEHQQHGRRKGRYEGRIGIECKSH